MQTVFVDGTYNDWRNVALQAIARGLTPDAIEWRETGGGSASLFELSQAWAASEDVPVLRVSKTLGALLHDAALFRDQHNPRWAFLYKVIWRWSQGDRAVESAADEDGSQLYKMAKTVRREKHDMIAYVRMRRRDPALGAPEYVAWYEPAHDVLEWAANHFAERMGRTTWLITTPSGAAMWNGSELHLERREALAVDHAPNGEDEAEDLWLTYYKSTFNPARLNEEALHQHMPVRFWKNLPEGALIPGMVSHARSGARKVAQASGVGELDGKRVAVTAERAQPSRDAPSSLDACRRCDLWSNATQAVSGEGPVNARIMLIGEQPGDQEDLKGRPFVGPAGQLLDTAMQSAGMQRDAVYMTNAVKHFKWEPRGKRRLHKTPAQREVDACSYWLDKELSEVSPRVIVTLGATALGSLLGSKARLSNLLDQPFEHNGSWVIATYHPSFALRQPDDTARNRAVETIVSSLKKALELAR